MASVPTFSPNPYSDFEPSQWSNPYSSFQNSGIPFPASYVGWPTDSMGNPIQAPPGMTLNQTPSQPPAQTAAQMPNAQWGINNAMLAGQYGNPRSGVPVDSVLTQMQNNNAAYGIGGQGQGPIEAARLAQIKMAQGQSPGAQQAAQGAGAASPSGLTSQQYLSLLAHPNPVVTPGATVPQAASSAQPGPGMLQQFLANYKPGATGPGSGFTNSFYKALGGA